MKRSYYSASLTDFLREPEESVLGKLSLSHSFALEDLQKNAWLYQIRFLKDRLSSFKDGTLLFEYSIPRMGLRVDNIFISDDLIFVLEFKVGADEYLHHDLLQTLDYALDLKNFHAGSHEQVIVPMLIATDAPAYSNEDKMYADFVWSPFRVNKDTFLNEVHRFLEKYGETDPIDPRAWESSAYAPTPTIVEAAQALYRGHDVEEISRSDAANISNTTDAVAGIINYARANNTKSICFVTGVPGSGKTLAGLNLASEHYRSEHNEHAVFLSGNGPLVKVLQEALARYEVETSDIRKAEALSKTRAFIQNIHFFRDEGLISDDAPIEKVAVFDEAQRAWDVAQTRKFMAQKKGVPDFDKSEPEFLIEIMDRHSDWAVIICLIGGGQEINTGEAGLPEWFHVLGEQFPHWKVYVSDRLTEYEYDRGQRIYAEITPQNLEFNRDLHLSVSIRSFRSERVAAFIKAMLDLEVEGARGFKTELEGKYPIVLTRDLEVAKRWVREQARGSERVGLIAASGAHRLRPYGITVRASVDPPNWFLNDDQDVRSSYYLEEVATEFDIQGLELDWTIVGWDADLRYSPEGWQSYAFRGTEWQHVRDKTRQLYLKNAYRVLLTRARQGFILFIPEGDLEDRTRLPDFYDPTYRYLLGIGIEEIF